MAVLEVCEHLVDRVVEPHCEDLPPAMGEQHLVRGRGRVRVQGSELGLAG